MKSLIKFASNAGLLSLLVFAQDSHAGVFEFSLGFGYNKTSYSERSFVWNRRFSSAISYHINDMSEIEFGFQHAIEKTFLVDESSGLELQNTKLTDKVYSLSWVQTLLGRDYSIRPYFKAGIGQMNRDIEGRYAGGYQPEVKAIDAITAVGGVGMRVQIASPIVLKTEVTSYMPRANIGKYRDNLAFMVGLAVYF